MLEGQLNSYMHDWRVITVVFQPDFKDAQGNLQRASYLTIWERKDS